MKNAVAIVRPAYQHLPAPGSALYLQLPAQALHFFDTQRGLRME
ncbi:hypothetical protein [Serratia rubidaea]|nr:hypothetical protein [Serratia rubidaea]WBF45276.1 hypothetical protein OLD77_22175 [Serratia rubidaea]